MHAESQDSRYYVFVLNITQEYIMIKSKYMFVCNIANIMSRFSTFQLHSDGMKHEITLSSGEKNCWNLQCTKYFFFLLGINTLFSSPYSHRYGVTFPLFTLE
uniref:Uncharacterized protein n=1 Tax=Cacopsylla melanoneura TaxID=428564 RepID=A0A8D8M3W1_9HEMI